MEFLRAREATKRKEKKNRKLCENENTILHSYYTVGMDRECTGPVRLNRMEEKIGFYRTENAISTVLGLLHLESN